MRQNLIVLQGEIDQYVVTVGDFNIPLPEMDRYSRQKISKETVEFNNSINQLNIVIYIQQWQNICFSCLPREFGRQTWP